VFALFCRHLFNTVEYIDRKYKKKVDIGTESARFGQIL